MLLFTVVATWNNYFLPLIMLKRPGLVPAHRRPQPVERPGHRRRRRRPIFNLVITGSLLTIVPLVVAFLFLQRYWQSGLGAGSVKQ